MEMATVLQPKAAVASTRIATITTRCRGSVQLAVTTGGIGVGGQARLGMHQRGTE
ncbi:hypothetical protein GCM10027162_67990 [Streptomyces incanus]